MIKTKTETVEREVVESASCDRCGLDLLEMIEANEALYYSDTGGYGCVWGDGATLSFDLCQRCIYELVKPFARLDGVRISEDFNE